MYGKPKPEKGAAIPGPGNYQPKSLYKPLGGIIQKSGRTNELI